MQTLGSHVLLRNVDHLPCSCFCPCTPASMHVSHDQSFETHPEVTGLGLAASDSSGAPVVSDVSFREVAKMKEAVIVRLVKVALTHHATQLRTMKEKGLLPTSPLALVMDEVTLGACLSPLRCSRDHCVTMFGVCRHVRCRVP